TDNLHGLGDPALLAEVWRHLPFFIDVVATADFAASAATEASPPSQEAEPTVPAYLTTSLFLSTSVAYLLAHPQGFEQIHLVTGRKEGEKRRTLERMGRVALATQSLVGASVDQLDLMNCLGELDAFGMQLHGMCHCH